MKTVSLFSAFVLLGAAITGCSKQAAANTNGPSTPVKSSLTKLGIEDVKVGDGGEFGIKEKVRDGDRLYMEYTGTLADGTVFDSNTDSSKAAFGFTIGTGAVIKGWDQGLLGMRIGGERKLSIPPSLGYAEKAQGKIPANSDLFFDVKLLDVVAPGTENDVTPDDIKIGTGPEIAKGDSVTVHYTVTDPKGKEVDSDNGNGFTWVYGSGSVYPSLEVGIAGMKQGGVRLVRLSTSVTMMASNRAAMMQEPAPQVVKVELAKVKPAAK